MKYQGILLDIDNTLYSYNISHKLAFRQVVLLCMNRWSLDEKEIVDAYQKARKMVQVELGNTASSHNRLLYFQKMLELLKLNPLAFSMLLYNTYWDNFIESITPFDGIYDLLEKYKYKICLVTDLTAHIQYRKIKKLKLDQYISHIVTSEEAGMEKPHPYMFLTAVHKLKMNVDEVCMIGDNFKKDIVGASNLGIDAFWLNLNQEKHLFPSQKIEEVSCFHELQKFL